MGKEEFIDDIQQKISDKMEIKASLQALHLKEEQLKMPEGLKYWLWRVIDDVVPRQQLKLKRIVSAMCVEACCQSMILISDYCHEK